MGALDGKVAVVTGGASGIGLASSRRLAAEGATVVVVDANGEEPSRRPRSSGASPCTPTSATSRDWERILDAGRGLGGIDFAYLNAGVTTGEQDITKLTDEQYRRILSVNVDGIVFGTRAVVPELVARGGGALVATSSLAGIVAFAGDPIYTLTKHAVVGLRARRGASPGRAGHHHQRHLPGTGGHAAHRRRDPRRPRRGRVPAHRPRGRRRGRARVRPGRGHRSGRRRAAGTSRRSRTASVVRPGPASPGVGGKDPARMAGRRRTSHAARRPNEAQA